MVLSQKTGDFPGSRDVFDMRVLSDANRAEAARRKKAILTELEHTSLVTDEVSSDIPSPGEAKSAKNVRRDRESPSRGDANRWNPPV